MFKRKRIRELEALVARAWNEGARAEAIARDGDEWAITQTCSVDNPYLEWIPTGWHVGTYKASPRIPKEVK